LPDVSLYRHFCRIPLYPIAAIFLPPANWGKAHDFRAAMRDSARPA
jgi:hypothetical protein